MRKLFSSILLIASFNSFGQNAKPSVAAGNNVAITLPTSTVSLVGKACDADGSVSIFKWSGNAGTITSPNSAATTVTGLSAAGNYVFKLKATDNSGLTDSSSVTVVVNPALPPTNNTAPRAYAGNDVSIQLPTNSVNLIGKGTDADGIVTAYLWTKEVGSGGSFSNPNAATATFSGLTAGEYRLRLTVTDNNGSTGSDTIHIKVSGANPPPPPPDTSTNNGYSLVYQNGFNTINDIDPCDHQQWGSDAIQNHLSTTIFRTGPGSFKSVPSSVSSGIRSEVQLNGPNDANCTSPYEGICEYDAYYDNFFCGSGHSLQIHPATNGGSGTGLYHVGCNPNRFDFVSVESGQSGTHYPVNYNVPLKQWIHIKIQYKWGAGGYWLMWIDGVQVCNVLNKKVGDGSAIDWKIGTNMWLNQSSVIYYDNLKIWKKL